MCEEKWKREEKENQDQNRIIQEAIVAAALANRAETCLAGKAPWGNKLPTAGQVAKTAALKAREASKMAQAQQNPNVKAWMARKRAKGAKPAKTKETQDHTVNEAPEAEQEKTKCKNRLRIQRGR